MIDSHTHLDSLRELTADDAIRAAQQVGVDGLVSIGCSLTSLPRTLAIAHRHDGYVRVAAGVHPQQAKSFDVAHWESVCRGARDPLVCAIGETGFDQYHEQGFVDEQTELFRLHVELANELELPLVIHTRAAERLTLDALARHEARHGVVLHCFGLPAQLDEVLEHDDWYCSFAGNVTYKGAVDLHAAAKRIPRQRLLVETDAPYLAPVPFRGKANQPSYVRHTLEFVAALRGESFADVDAYTTANAARLFGFELDGGGQAISVSGAPREA